MIMMKKVFFVLFFFSFLESAQLETHRIPAKTMAAPWFTGPLLAPSSLTVPPGHIDIEPYIYVTANTGRYNSHWHASKIQTFWINLFQPLIAFGLTSWLDFEIYPGVLYNYTKGAGHWGIADMPIGVDIQLYTHTPEVAQWNYSFLLRIQEILPIGKYKNLDPKKLLTDASGAGSWQTQIALVWGNLFHLGGIHFMTWRTALQYTLPAPVSVSNVNVYGGSSGTHGKVYPGQSLMLDTAVEITLAKHWAFAMDLVGIWGARDRFSGHTSTINDAPASAQFSLAPALEYNWNANLGLIAGCWFTVAGRNDVQFTSGVIAFNYFH